MKKWFKINENIEYSSDFDFFREHQIFISKSLSNIYSFCSKIEARTFDKIQASRVGLTPIEIELKIKLIHRKLLKGEYVKGVFVD